MRRLRDGREQSRLLTGSPQFNKGGLLKAGIFSLLLHIGLIAILGLSAKPLITKVVPSVYWVTIRPFVPPGYGIQQGSSSLSLPGAAGGLPSSPPVGKLRHVGDPKWREIVEGIKPDQKKAERKVEKPREREVSLSTKKQKTPDSKKGERPTKEKESNQSLQEAIEEIHKRVALDEIQKKVARRGNIEKRSSEGQSVGTPSQETTGSFSGASPILGSEAGTGARGFPGGSPWGSSSMQGSSLWQSKLNDYYSMIWAKIEKEWTLPENLPKGKTDLETIIVIIIERDGKVQKSWFEKRSGNALYDQMAMRAIKKAGRLPPIPKEFSDNTFEIGIRFHPD
jgi:TonB family protein